MDHTKLHYNSFAKLRIGPRHRMALVIPAHNEELVIADTIRSAIKAGQAERDVFVVADGCSDRTVEIAARLVGEDNVLSQPQAGKAKAIQHAIRHFNLVGRYEWLHIADADGLFDLWYFTEIANRLAKIDDSYVAVTGHIQSMEGGWISRYRTYEYTIGLEILRRIQAFFGVIPVMPGPTSIFRTSILDKLDFESGTLAEDMDLTMQIHRRRLGRIAYEPKAKTYSQDPKDLGDYIKQVSRWYRGNFQVIQRHRVGLRRQKIDAYVAYVMLEQWALIAMLIAVPFWCWWTTNYRPVAYMFLVDALFFFMFTVGAAARNNRANVVSAFPLFYVLRFLTLVIFVRSWFEIVVQHKFSAPQAGWSVAGRRYRIMTDAVSN